MNIFKFFLLMSFFSAFVFSHAHAAEALFDPPLEEIHTPLPAAPDNPQAKAELSCFYYSHSMIKQIDRGEKGAEQLSITYIQKNHPKPSCLLKNGDDEKIISPQALSGYFKGAVDNYIFFDSADDSGAGNSFAIFDAVSGQEIFHDTAVKIYSITQLLPHQDPELRPWHENPIKLIYQRSYEAPCSLDFNKKQCWNIIKNITNLPAAFPPDCIAAYQKMEKGLAPRENKDDVLKDPSIIDYDVKTVIDTNGTISIAPISKAKDCYPAP